jgi:hypothetical protein
VVIDTARFPRLRWVVVVSLGVGMLAASYLVWPFHGESYPDDHGLVQLASYEMPWPMEEYYACLIDWAVEHADELWITDDFILEPRPERDGSFRGDFEIDASGWTGVSGGQGEGGLYVHYRFRNSRSYPFPCGNPSQLAAGG